MESTCEDVEEMYGIRVCGKFSASIQRRNEYIRFNFAGGECRGAKQGYEDYDVPRGTLTSITVIVRIPNQVFLADLGYQNEEFIVEPDGDILGSFVFTNEKKGIRFTSSEKYGLISSYSIFPSVDYSNIRCGKVDTKRSPLPSYKANKGKTPD